jgi:cyclic pyranopterin phosphate synthase
VNRTNRQNSFSHGVFCRRTSDLIPLCHPLPLDKVHVDIRLEGNTAIVECECRVTHKTGVEMEVRGGASFHAHVES